MANFQLPQIDGRTVLVLGGGVLGRRIACAWAASGFDVAIRDPGAEQRIAAVHYCTASMSLFSDGPKRGKVEAFEDLNQAVQKAWLVIEAVPEKLELKISTFKDLVEHAPADAILCSNSSSFKSRDMVQDLDTLNKRRILNMHYYMPPDNRVVELMTDGETDPSIFPFLVEKLKEINMHPYVARKESTGLIFNRLWAAVKREILYILADEVSTPEEIDNLWREMFGGRNGAGPVAMMDQVGLDTVSFIEKHYIEERGLPTKSVDFLKQYTDVGKLGAKSGKGGLLPPGGVAKSAPKTSEVPLLYFLDIGMASKDLTNVMHAGRILVGASDGRPMKTIVSSQSTPDGLDISIPAGKLFWTSMGIPSLNDGAVYSCNLDGSDQKAIVSKGGVHTPKQICVDNEQRKIYFSDREGLRVWRCNFDGSSQELLVQTGDFRKPEERVDQKRWCVGIAVSHVTGKFYWTQKGTSKGFQGRIFQANIDFPRGQDGTSRQDIECLFQNLPEPIDLDIDNDNKRLYWSDRGELPLGNSINSANLDGITPMADLNATSCPGKDYTLIARNLHESIGIKLDTINQHIYTTDMGGSIYRFDLDGGNRMRFYEDEVAYTGITLAYV